VGSQLFKVHRHFLRKESEVFNWMFACPPGADSPDGGSDERAIPLHGVAPAEFEALLDFFYEECVKSPTLWAFFCRYESLKEIPTP
jgi:hypothetical protein